jgi:FKBP-type peptidyl-prolyl cis-trans isomerase FklB
MNNNKHVALSMLMIATFLLASCGGGKSELKVSSEGDAETTSKSLEWDKTMSKASLKNDADTASFYLGYNWGLNVVNSDWDDFNIKVFTKGIQEAIKQGKEIDEERMQEIRMFLNDYFTKMQARTLEKAKKEGEKFLEENKKKSGVFTLPSGLQYKIIKDGSGIKPTREDQVDVVYHGTLIDGKVFDSSKDRGDTATFSVSGVVAGFTEALTLMSEGSTWEVYIPSELGYGEHVRPGGLIKPNSVLIFEIDLVKVIQKEQ